MASGSSAPDIHTTVDVREEYAHAFRTESYNLFWTRVVAIFNGARDRATCISPAESTAAARLSSYRLFAEHLLDPDQPTACRMLESVRHRPKAHSLLSYYFSETANASFLCSSLLKDIDHTRLRYRSFKTSFQALEVAPFSNVITCLSDFSNSLNPFASSAPSSCRVRVIQANCSKLLKRLELNRDEARAQLRLIKTLRHSSGMFLVVLTASLTVILASHAFALLVAAPALIGASSELGSTRQLARVSAQLDAAAKGTYILNRDLDTISRLVARLNDELEDMRAMVRFWLERREDWLQAGGEVARQLRKNDESFSQQLDELEEHLYLCFMTINRARNLVVKEILNPEPDPGQCSSTATVISRR